MKKNIARRLGAGFLSGMMLISATFPALADSDDDGPYTVPKVEIKTKMTDQYSEAQLKDGVVEYGEIEFLVKYYNNTVISNRYTYNSLRDAFEEAESEGAYASPSGGFSDSDKASDEALEQINDGIKSYQSQIKELNESLKDITDAAQKQSVQDKIDVLTNTVAALNTQKASLLTVSEVNTAMSDMMSSMANGSGMTADDLRNYYLQFAEVESTLVKTAQSMYPTYYQLMYNLDQLNANLTVAETAYQGTLVQKELGMCTDNDVASALYNVTSVKSSIANLENQIASLKQEFCKLVGKNFNEEVTFGELPEIDYEYIANINLYEDIEAALANNYGVRSKQNAIKNYGPGTSYEARNSDAFALTAERENVRTEVNKAYLDIQTAQSELQLAKEKLNNAERTMKMSEEKYNLGLISKLEYEQQKVSYVAEEAAYKTAESKLLDAVNSYQWCLQGL